MRANSIARPHGVSRCILLCTLGASWAVIPEVFGWLAPEVVDLYAHHPDRPALDALRRQHGLQPPDELWICTTEGRQTNQSLRQLMQWWQYLDAPLPLRIWTAADTDQLASQQECAHIRELILRAALMASEQTSPGGQLILSLAGGRKTMSADLQAAGSIFGAHAWLHVVGPEPMPTELIGRTEQERADQPRLFSEPLDKALASAIRPLIAGVGQRSELLDLELAGRMVEAKHFPLPLPEAGHVQPWPMPKNGDSLFQELQQRQQQSSALMGNFLAQLADSEHHENWRSLYRLPPGDIQSLRDTTLDPTRHRQWLLQLPKADLHRHLGGCLHLNEQRQVAQAIWQALTPAQRQHSMQVVQPLLNSTTQIWPWTWNNTFRQAPTGRAACSAALLLHASNAQLEQNLYAVTTPRVALKSSHPQGFAAYERPGELSGSALLCHPAAVQPYAQAIVRQTREEGITYLELRGSPHKYQPENPRQFLLALRDAIAKAGAQTSGYTKRTDTDTGDVIPRIGFIWILDRREPSSMARIVRLAVQAKQELGDFLLGLDLAGDEGTNHPEQLAPAFHEAFAACLPITIHAGEGESAENIWQAAYHLHADRIGHGLTLAQNPRLAARFRDRGICIELCPTSNREVVGFKDPGVAESSAYPSYPLRQFLQAGLPITLCTDNPGISRTTLADEYLAAARMSEPGLSQWEALALIRQAFVHAFLSSAEREVILKKVDRHIFELLAKPTTHNTI